MAALPPIDQIHELAISIHTRACHLKALHDAMEHFSDQIASCGSNADPSGKIYSLVALAAEQTESIATSADAIEGLGLQLRREERHG